MDNGAKSFEPDALDDLFAVIPMFPQHHATSGPLWRLWDGVAKDAVFKKFGSRGLATPARFGPFGPLRFPYTEFGAVKSTDLFGIDELIIFAFYLANRSRYRKVADFGANIGLHSTVLHRCGFEVISFEPDPNHLRSLHEVFRLNDVAATVHEAAVSISDGESSFVRVLGNTTSSHLAGAKAKPYGDLEKFTVRMEAALPHLAWADLVKIDIEGHEAVLITGVPRDVWLNTDAIVEIGSDQNADLVFEHFQGSAINLFAQKIGWDLVKRREDMPESHRDGSLFLSAKGRMNWSSEV